MFFQMAKKLAGHSKGTATWVTNVGNEDGQVLMSVLTCQEELSGLGPMVESVIKRYASADIDPPQVLYVDWDCCGDSPTSKLFPDLALYATFHFWLHSRCSPAVCRLHGWLSKCIFVWKSEDLHQLSDAKRFEVLKKKVPAPSTDNILVADNEGTCSALPATDSGTEETARLLGKYRYK